MAILSDERIFICVTCYERRWPADCHHAFSFIIEALRIIISPKQCPPVYDFFRIFLKIGPAKLKGRLADHAPFNKNNKHTFVKGISNLELNSEFLNSDFHQLWQQRYCATTSRGPERANLAIFMKK